ncbi:MAG: site-2 protease family protein [Chloroflexota bacterium]|nr:site-2 protease family protein [Chloroflexota bacterium]
MGRSLTIATVRGIEIKVHWSFVLILAYGAFTWGRIASQDAAGETTSLVTGAIYGVLLVLLLFVIVVFHELGHGITAQYFNIPVRDITLLPLGGVARLERQPDTPWQELLVAIAGPAVNFALMLILLPLLFAVMAVQDVNSASQVLSTYTSISLLGLVTFLVLTNLILGVFNLLPAFPMDGGRILRSLLSLALPFTTATRLAANIGRALAVMMGIWAVVNRDIFLTMIAIFIYMGASDENAETRVRDALEDMQAGDVYDRHGLVLGAAQPLSAVVNTILTSHQTNFAVLVGSQLAGVITTVQVIKALRRDQSEATVGTIMDRDYLRVEQSDSLYLVRTKMVQQRRNVAAVFDGPIFLGLISAGDIHQAYKLRNASAKARAPQEDPTTAPAKEENNPFLPDRD